MEAGTQTTYVIELRNEGTSDLTNIQLKNEIAEEMSFIKVTAPANYYTVAGREIIFSRHLVLKPGSKLIYIIVCEGIRPGNAKNRATVSLAQFELPIINEEGTSVHGPSW